jgi:L-galactono-1,4-lactone dehydrogenase
VYRYSSADDATRKSTTTQLEAAVLGDADDNTTTILNWSGTHAVHVKNEQFWEPETVADVERIVQHCHETGQAARPLGSALSPNGLAFHETGMISMANLDKVLNVNTDANTVTVQAGARISQVVDALRPYGLTLHNLASISEQQMGGFIQVGAHGTGRCVAPVDHYVTSLSLVTPSKGTITLTEADGNLFHLAKVGLGCLGVVVEVTMQCIPAHNLVEHTFVLTRKEAKEQLDVLLKEHKHMR